MEARPSFYTTGLEVDEIGPEQVPVHSHAAVVDYPIHQRVLRPRLPP
jgi:hypothetical protein